MRGAHHGSHEEEWESEDSLGARSISTTTPSREDLLIGGDDGGAVNGRPAFSSSSKSGCLLLLGRHVESLITSAGMMCLRSVRYLGPLYIRSTAV